MGRGAAVSGPGRCLAGTYLESKEKSRAQGSYKGLEFFEWSTKCYCYIETALAPSLIYSILISSWLGRQKSARFSLSGPTSCPWENGGLVSPGLSSYLRFLGKPAKGYQSH